MDVKEKKIIDAVSKVLSLQTNEIDLNTNSDNCLKWDSLAQINIIISLEKIFNKKVKTSEINNLKSIKNLIKYF